MKISNIAAAFCSAASLFLAVPANATETISVDFTKADGGVSTGLYSGIIDIIVQGTGVAAATNLNDAFYIFTQGSPVNHKYFFQLTFGTSTLTGTDPSSNALNYLVGGLPAYDPSHTYSFQLDTGVTDPTQLHFGVGDSNYWDNSGNFFVTILSPSAVPEPATWAMLIMGMGLVGLQMRRRSTKVSFGNAAA